ncbi:MAG: ribosome small subunit-dependent GTPase A [Candidatus Saccharibacteria bacterium]|nr:ribosome small subunit-dependent GTPase A [Pseudorhodobacter sp.]
MTDPILAALGWTPDFMAQLDATEIGTTFPARVTGVHRNRLETLTADGAKDLIPASDLNTGNVAVGDWLIARGEVALRVLTRRTLLQRKSAGTTMTRQLIAANVDTALITSSCNNDFNPARLERYLILCASSGIEPVLVLTKADTCPDPETYLEQGRALHPGLAVVALNAHGPDVRSTLQTWCRTGKTVVLLGSSGVGKTTLANALTDGNAAVQGIREDDAKGRHTTTARYLVAMTEGGWLIDTPGVRELQLTDVSDGIDVLFGDLTMLALTCRFTNCTHDREPGCAIRAAIAAGEIDDNRLVRWQKLLREDRQNSESIQQAHQRNRNFGKMNRKASAKHNPPKHR